MFEGLTSVLRHLLDRAAKTFHSASLATQYTSPLALPIENASLDDCVTAPGFVIAKPSFLSRIHGVFLRLHAAAGELHSSLVATEYSHHARHAIPCLCSIGWCPLHYAPWTNVSNLLLNR